MLAEGDKVDVKITDVDMENKKISLSIRALLEEGPQDEELQDEAAQEDGEEAPAGEDQEG